MTALITQLTTFPIKSCAGIEHKKIGLDALGLQHDRQMMIVQDNGQFLSQRKHPQMALIQPTIITTNTLKLSAPGMSDIDAKHNGGSEVMEVTVWQDTFKAINLHPEIDQWLSEYLAQKVKLVQYQKISHRHIDTDYAKSNEVVAFADGYPLLVTHEATLTDINKHLESPVDMSRFRANIVLKTDQPAWHEMNWSKLDCGDATIDLVKPCSRCVMTGVDQKTGRTMGTEVLKTLSNQLSQNGKAIFGINGIPRLHKTNAAVVEVGQSVQII